MKTAFPWLRTVTRPWLALALLTGLETSSAAAASPLVSAPAGKGQAALSVGLDAAGRLKAATCSTAPCDVTGGLALDVPAAIARSLKSAHASVVGLGQGRSAVVLSAPDPRGPGVWQAVVVAPLGGGPAGVLFQGMTGLLHGEWGLRSGPMVQVVTDPRKTERKILVGEQHEDVTLCGRPTILAPQVLLPDDLKLHPAKVQRLDSGERDGATRIVAQRVEDPAAAPSAGQEPAKPVPLLRATAASSAIGLPAALTDGDPETTWAENRGGSGKGEFVVMTAPDSVPIVGFDLTVRPAQAHPQGGVAARAFWLATDKSVFWVTMPENAWDHPGARYRVSLPAPVTTGCVALATETAFSEGRDAHVTFAELSAIPELDTSNIGVLLGALNGGDARAEAAAAALSAMGPQAFDRVVSTYDQLSPDGRRLALNVIDHAPCAQKSPLYVRAMFSTEPGERTHARDRIRRCGPEATDALVAGLEQAPARGQPLLASELSLLAPARAVLVIAPRMLGSSTRRHLLRVAFAQASRSEQAYPSVRRVLGDTTLPTIAAIDVLRSLGARVGAYEPEASQLLLRLSSNSPDFRTRYLLLEPAAFLARRNPTVQALVSRALTADASPYVRLRAAQVSRYPGLYRAELVQATSDAASRVREAAVQALASRASSFATGAVSERLRKDEWPFVRVAAAKALAEQGPSTLADQSLGDALDDQAVTVRSAVIEALGRRGTRAQAPALRELLDDDEEPVEVRASAARALGRMCDTQSVDSLVHLALALRDPLADASKQLLGWAALEALGRIQPRDLTGTLRPLLAREGIPEGVKRAARAALRAAPACRPVR
ncbi:MAG: HEAT repeat domain-containing protein [Polyangiaceae bacterium]|nr:HEAT repeat domain-containing protein [Polyangiaceae bacterium]